MTFLYTPLLLFTTAVSCFSEIIDNFALEVFLVIVVLFLFLFKIYSFV